MAPNGNPMHDNFDFSPLKPFQNTVYDRLLPSHEITKSWTDEEMLKRNTIQG